MKKWRRFLLFIIAAMLLAACGEKTVNIQEQMELGQKYLLEADYEKAIVVFTKIISIDPKNLEAVRSLASAYREVGKPEEAADTMTAVILQAGSSEEDLDSMNELLKEMDNLSLALTYAEMAYTQTGDERFIRTLFVINGKRSDFDAISRNIKDLEMFKGMKDDYLEEVVQYFVDNHDTVNMEKLSKVLKEQELCSGTILVIDMWTQFETGGEEAVIKLLEQYYTDKEELPAVGPDSEIYIGGYDEEGQRSGYGICFYGSDIKTHSRIYIGNWEKGVRSGEGRAYLRADYRIQCQWADDYPAGEVNILQEDTMVIGTLDYGHVATPMNLYENGEWISVHCTPDAGKASGYSYQTAGMERPGTCNHIKSHTYCWDCRQKESEGE